MAKEGSAEAIIRDIKRKTRRKYSAEEKIRIVVEGLRGEQTIAATRRLQIRRDAVLLEVLGHLEEFRPLLGCVGVQAQPARLTARVERIGAKRQHALEVRLHVVELEMALKSDIASVFGLEGVAILAGG